MRMTGPHGLGYIVAGILCVLQHNLQSTIVNYVRLSCNKLKWNLLLRYYYFIYFIIINNRKFCEFKISSNTATLTAIANLSVCWGRSVHPGLWACLVWWEVCWSLWRSDRCENYERLWKRRSDFSWHLHGIGRYQLNYSTADKPDTNAYLLEGYATESVYNAILCASKA